MSDQRSIIPICFRPIPPSSPANSAGDDSPIPHADAIPNLATFVYHTEIGLFSLTWSCNSILRRSVNLHVQLCHHHSRAVHVQIKPFLFWKRRGCTSIDLNHPPARSAQLFWDLARAKFESGPEPRSGYYIAIVVEGSIILLIGDRIHDAYARTRVRDSILKPQALVLRREHVTGVETYSTRVSLGDKMRTMTIYCSIGDNPQLCFLLDRETVLEIKQLKWKFRGNGRIEFDGVRFQVSWDIYNWIFDETEGPAVFMFRFDEGDIAIDEKVLMNWRNWGYGMNAIERKKMQKEGLLMTTRCSTPSSISSSASASGSSVMEWASMEEEPDCPLGFSLIVYAWRR